MTRSQTAKIGKAMFGKALFGLKGIIVNSTVTKTKVKGCAVYHEFRSWVEEE